MWDASNEIDPSVKIVGDVKIGKNNKVLPYSVLMGPLTIGDGNWIGPHVVIGTPGQDTRDPHHDTSDKPIVIGNHNIIREFTAIQKPCYDKVTQIGHHVFLMQSVHIPHDAILEDHVVITPMVAMGGIVHLMEGANLALGVSVHQRTVIGAYSIVAAGAVTMKNVKPFSRHIPGKPISVNTYAVEKFGFMDAAEEIQQYVLKGVRPSPGPVLKIIERYEMLHLRSKRDQYE